MIARGMLSLAALAALAVPLSIGGSQPAEARGCIKGAIIGGVAGHFLGHHGIAGAAAGCAVGHLSSRPRHGQYRDSRYGYGEPVRRYNY